MTPQDWICSEHLVRVCILALADKLMEETEELCLQREQREVGARQGHSPPPPALWALSQPLCADLCFWH